ncbi:transcriptional regulator, CopG family [mine drainage metagenome]|uniref:Transcriptional regulator, CopG family n=1 Tax=mine drainage metagenome TaxID=410659 RepID=T1D9K7_9ZZZZ
MAETSERVTVRIPQEILEGLKRIQEARGHPTISDTIRVGLEHYIQVELPSARARKTVVSLPHQDYLHLEELAEEGVSVDIDDAIRTAVREYIRIRLEQFGGRPSPPTRTTPRDPRTAPSSLRTVPPGPEAPRDR